MKQEPIGQMAPSETIRNDTLPSSKIHTDMTASQSHPPAARQGPAVTPIEEPKLDSSLQDAIKNTTSVASISLPASDTTPSTSQQPLTSLVHHVNPDPPITSQSREGTGQHSERDSINALLSLGRDLQYEGEKDTKRTEPDTGLSTLSAAAGPPKKRAKTKLAQGAATAATTVGYRGPADFWYWLPPGESIGEWDVLCGRGGESNNFIGNKKYRRIVNERKEAYRSIPLKHRKDKTAFVRNLVQHVNNCGGRFVDVDEVTGQFYVVTMEKARKKTSQALRETKELKWLETDRSKETKSLTSTKVSICPYCQKPGHKTKIAKACLRHHEWLDSNRNQSSATSNGDSNVKAPAIVDATAVIVPKMTPPQPPASEQTNQAPTAQTSPATATTNT